MGSTQQQHRNRQSTHWGTWAPYQKWMASNFGNYKSDALNETLQEFYAAIQSNKAGDEQPQDWGLV